MNREILSIPLDHIEVGERLRAVDADYVAMLAASMEERGQDTPITVGPADANGRHRLFAGAHRTAAARAAGLSHIDAIVSDATGLEAELLEIDENLMRRELSQLDRSVFLAKRKELYEALHPQTAHGKASKNKGKEKSQTSATFPGRFSAATAERLGLSERTIQQAVARAKIDPQVRAMLASHPVADSGAELDKIAAQPALVQIKIASALTRPDSPARNVSAALSEFAGAPSSSPAAETQRLLQALLSAWRKAGANKAGKAARKQFLAYLVSEGEIASGEEGKAA
ncbi:ParB/RepB/Spo0J family partition protein [Falsiroseomonas sp.]|uniref:ParB/RepB/Spo0J family partition protein n=1 Tax=Falsiroseomonas sp. TaxID=2870721 RepID=UPI003F72B74C